VNRRSGTIYLFDQQRVPVMWWDFKEAFPVKWSGPGLRADAAQIAVESIELRHRGLSRPQFAGTLAGALAGLNLGFSASLDVSGSLF
jgi:hypothetical protein